MAGFGTNFSPAQVMFGAGGTTGKPYVSRSSNSPVWGLPGKTMQSATPAAPANKTLGPESVRATGTGPFDAAYRQNLATYAGGQFQRPGGNLAFNPTDFSNFPGQPTGGGSAPVAGMPNTLLDMALGGQGFSWAPPAQPSTAVKPPRFNDMQQWMNQFLMNGRSGRMGVFQQ